MPRVASEARAAPVRARSLPDRPRVVICGTKFGRVYLAAFTDPSFPFELAGVLARGSERSSACAESYGVPLFEKSDDLPADIDIACVVVSAGINGGKGAELAQALMDRGINVLQEHPLHHGELAACLRSARTNGVSYHLNTHYIHLEPVRHLLGAARRLFDRQQPLFVDAVCAIQVTYPLLDILGQALGRVRPCAFNAAPVATEELLSICDQPPPFRSLDGAIGGTPLGLRVQNQLDPSDPDNHAHLLHRITFGTEGGQLTLLNTHGPVFWTPRPHLPRGEAFVSLHELDGAQLDYPTAEPLGAACAPSYREILRSIWPAGIRRALVELRTAITGDDDTMRRGQYHLTLCRVWQDLTGLLGYPELMSRSEPALLPAAAVDPYVEEAVAAP